MTQQIGDSDLLHTWGATGDVVEPGLAKKDTGWESGERPPHEYMNWIHNALAQAMNHILKNGTPAWNSATEYNAGASVQHNGSIWVAQATSTNSQPSDGNSNWARLLDLDELDARYEPVLQHNDSATTDPDANDDSNTGYSVRSNWINTNTGEVFRCIDATPGAAVWAKTTLTRDELGSAATVDTGTSAGQVPLIGTASATTTAAGLVELLAQSEAEAGTDNSRAATILRVAQYLATRLATNGGDILVNAMLGQADGVCDLDGNTRVPNARLYRGVANGICDLDGNTLVPLTRLNAAVMRRPTQSTSPSLSFNSWRTPSASRPTLVTLSVVVRTDGTNDGIIAVRVDESGGTTFDYSYIIGRAGDGLGANGSAEATSTFFVPPNAAYVVSNDNDPIGLNAITAAREFTL